MVGGYKIIDLKHTNFSYNTPVNIPGIYNAIENSVNKPVMVTNLSVSGLEAHAFFSTVYGVNANYMLPRLVGSGNFERFVVSSDDNIYYQAVQIVPGGSQSTKSGQEVPSASM